MKKILLLYLVFCILFEEGHAQLTQTKSVFSNGAAIGASSDSDVGFFNVGQTLVGSGQGGNYTLSSGFFAGISTDNLVIASIESENFPETYALGSGGLSVSITFNDATLVSSVEFSYRGISSSGSQTQTLTADGNTFTATLTDTDFESEIGVEYVFNYTTSGIDNMSNSGVTYTSIGDGEQELGSLSFGSEVTNYQIVAVPYNLNNNSVLNVFDELAPYDDTKWRLFHYDNGQTNEFNTFNSIELGKGYWLIVAERTTITLGEGTAAQVNSSTPYTLTLDPGWNQIGNPYPFSIDWSSVLSSNGDPAGVSGLFQLSGSTLGEQNSLDAFRGGFVENTSGSAIDISIPVDISSSGGRMESSEETMNDLEQEEWEVLLHVSNGKFQNKLASFGMRGNASQGKDLYDISRFPTPFEMADVYFTAGEEKLSRSMISSGKNGQWEFSLSGSSGITELSWDNSYFGENDKNLILIDLETNRRIDMKTKNQLMIDTEKSSDFLILFGSDRFIDQHANPTRVSLGDVYPNPVTEELNIPFALSKDQGTNFLVSVYVYDLEGKQVSKIEEGKFRDGFHSLRWVPDTEKIRVGVYNLVMEVDSKEKEWTFSKRIIIK